MSRRLAPSVRTTDLCGPLRDRGRHHALADGREQQRKPRTHQQAAACLCTTAYAEVLRDRRSGDRDVGIELRTTRTRDERQRIADRPHRQYRVGPVPLLDGQIEIGPRYRARRSTSARPSR